MEFPGPDATRKEIAAFYVKHGQQPSGADWIKFSGMNCNDYRDEDDYRPLCKGWDGRSRRCDCRNRRVYWDTDEGTGERYAMAD